MLYPRSGLDICKLNTKKREKNASKEEFQLKTYSISAWYWMLLASNSSTNKGCSRNGKIYISISRIWFIKVSLNSRLNSNHNNMHKKHYKKLSTWILLATIYFTPLRNSYAPFTNLNEHIFNDKVWSDLQPFASWTSVVSVKR